MNPYCEPPNLGSSFQQAHADRPERPGRQIDGVLSTGALRLVNGLDRSQIVSTVEEIIETGDQPA